MAQQYEQILLKTNLFTFNTIQKKHQKVKKFEKDLFQVINVSSFSKMPKNNIHTLLNTPLAREIPPPLPCLCMLQTGSL